MRDPHRIAHIIDKLEDLWNRYPDLRLGQLIENLRPVGPIDVFNTEDEQWEQQLDTALAGKGRFGTRRA